MSHPLAGVVTKLRNADDHLHRLQAESLAYLNDTPNARIITEVDPNDGRRGWFRFGVLRQPPLKLAAIAGDVVHNLRSALDYIVEELVKVNGHTPTFQHLYPICLKPEDLKAAIGKGRVHGISDQGMQLIEGFQPYQVKPASRSRHPLTHLHRLSNRDKHHMLAISALNAAFDWAFVSRSRDVLRAGRTTEPVGDGGVLAEIPTEFVIDGTTVQLQAQLTITIGFTEPAFSGFDVMGCLQNIREYIGQYLLPAFSTMFDPLPDGLRLTSHGVGQTKPSVVELSVLARQEERAKES